jgi:hypothetical protein
MRPALILAAVGAAVIAASSANADQPPPPRNNVCLDVSRIDHMQYPDNKTIMFYMTGGPVKVWRNTLPRECPGLAFEKGIGWEIRGGMVCSNMQTFYVLRRGTPCMLGAFEPAYPPRPPGPPVAN